MAKMNVKDLARGVLLLPIGYYLWFVKFLPLGIGQVDVSTLPGLVVRLLAAAMFLYGGFLVIRQAR